MSLATFKKKSANTYPSLTKRSGKSPGGYFIPQGPFGKNNTSLQLALLNPSTVGFSINGGSRNVGYIGKESKFSKQGTPFRGIYPYNFRKNSAQPVFNVNEVYTLGNQYQYIKPSVLSNFGMLHKKYRWAYTGQYPNAWVQPNYGQSNQTDTKSQGNYVHNLSVSNICVVDINNESKYANHSKSCVSLSCHNTPRNYPYTKFIKQPLDSSIQTMRIQQQCTNPTGSQKPFPFATNGDTCNNCDNFYLTPPDWYTK
jgi:hypothetical protein